MVDTHVHLLPGVDDGPETFTQAMEMARAIVASGARRVVVTPHFNHPRFPLRTRTELEEAWQRLLPHLPMGPTWELGAEIYVDSNFFEELGSQTREDLPCFGPSRCLLLEFPPVPVGPRPETVVHECLLLGFTPILAHPERIPYLGHDRSRLEELVESGALLQVTVPSLTGRWGPAAQQTGYNLVASGLAALLASDAHGAGDPPLAEAFQVLRSVGEARVRDLIDHNPGRLFLQADKEYL